jgi:hypothetical protein
LNKGQSTNITTPPPSASPLKTSSSSNNISNDKQMASPLNNTNKANSETPLAHSTSSNSVNKTTTTPTKENAKANSGKATPPSNLPNNSVIDQVIALYDFQSTTPETISFSKDNVINILEKSGDWWLGELNGKIGLLPFNYVQSISKTNG